MAGLLHFLVVASFVWMLLEALQLYLLVRMLSRVQVIQRDGLPRPYLYLIGYGVPTVIVGVSAWVNSGGYGTPTKLVVIMTKHVSSSTVNIWCNKDTRHSHTCEVVPSVFWLTVETICCLT